MTEKRKKLVFGIVFSFLFCFLCVGYAQLNDELFINGSVTADVQENVFIYEVLDQNGNNVDADKLRYSSTYVYGSIPAGAPSVTYKINFINKNAQYDFYYLKNIFEKNEELSINIDIDVDIKLESYTIIGKEAENSNNCLNGIIVTFARTNTDTTKKLDFAGNFKFEKRDVVMDSYKGDGSDKIEGAVGGKPEDAYGAIESYKQIGEKWWDKRLEVVIPNIDGRYDSDEKIKTITIQNTTNKLYIDWENYSKATIKEIDRATGEKVKGMYDEYIVREAWYIGEKSTRNSDPNSEEEQTNLIAFIYEGTLTLGGNNVFGDHLVIYGGDASGEIFVDDLSYSFQNLGHLHNGAPLINFWKLNTSNCNSMAYAFYNCSSLVVADATWDTCNIKDMTGMFENCTNMQVVCISSFDTSNVTSFKDMFKNCSSLTQTLHYTGNTDNPYYYHRRLNLSHFDFSSAKTTESMFEGCTSLIRIDLSHDYEKGSYNNANFKADATSDVTMWESPDLTNMKKMFYNCTSLKYLDLRGFNTRAAVSNGGMENMLNTEDDCNTVLYFYYIYGDDNSNVGWRYDYEKAPNIWAKRKENYTLIFNEAQTPDWPEFTTSYNNSTFALSS